MSRSKRFWGLVVILLVPLGIIVGKERLLAPTPAVLVLLGIAAVLCILGIVYGLREGRRAAREGRSLGND